MDERAEVDKRMVRTCEGYTVTQGDGSCDGARRFLRMLTIVEIFISVGSGSDGSGNVVPARASQKGRQG